MKYDVEMYIDSGFYLDDGDVAGYTKKIVKCRKPHKRMGGCDNEIQPGEHALYEKGFVDGVAMTCYTCLPCIEKWLEESGQVEVKSDETNLRA